MRLNDFGRHTHGRARTKLTAGVHETEGISDRDGIEDSLAGQRIDAAVGQSGSHHAPGLAVHFHRTQLKVQIHRLIREGKDK